MSTSTPTLPTTTGRRKRSLTWWLTHPHEHNHPALSHDHEPHEDPDKEHLRESHVHDHARPDASPA
jgi:hypothetical protein